VGRGEKTRKPEWAQFSESEEGRGVDSDENGLCARLEGGWGVRRSESEWVQELSAATVGAQAGVNNRYKLASTFKTNSGLKCELLSRLRLQVNRKKLVNDCSLCAKVH
jgi:hypothetical protein